MPLNSPTPLDEAAVQGIELESWAKMIPDLMYDGKTLYTRMKKGTKTYPVANITAAPGNVGTNTGIAQRPAFRVPVRVQSGAAIGQGTGDGDSLGRGSASQWISGDIQPIFLFSGCEITYLTQKSTNGKNRGMVAVRAQELKNSLDSFMRGVEALFQGDSSGMLDQIPTTAIVDSGTGGGVAGSATYSSITGLNNANQFQDQQLVQVFPSEGGTVRGSFRISYADGVAQAIYSTGLLPAGTTQGDYLMVAGSSGALGGSVAGIKTYQVTGNTGTVLGITKANYPGRFSTANINLNNNAVNPSVPYRAEILIGRGLGEDFENMDDFIWYGGPGQRLQITNLYQSVLIANAQDVKGDTALDMVKKHMVTEFGGREYVEGYNASPGRIDGLCLPSWGIAEMIEPSLYEFGNGVTSMPVPDPTGNGWLTSNIFYYNACLNLFNSNMKAGVYITNAAEPTI
jgi:hypothetical protein